MQESEQRQSLKMLDCFCGMGGVSDGFALEGFDVMGIDIVNAPKLLGYKHRFIQPDMTTLKGEDYRGFDVVWGSPPCRDFSLFAKRFGKTWKKQPPNPSEARKLVDAFLRFIEVAKPKLWIMENVPYLIEHLKIPFRFKTNLRCGPHTKNNKTQMVRAFWGNFPALLIPKDGQDFTMRNRVEVKARHRREHYIYLSKREERAKIPLACSCAFARACKEKLLNE